MKVIASYSKPEEAHLAASLLEANGIIINVRDSYTVGLHWMYSNAIGGVRLEVEDSMVQIAKEILDLPKEAIGILECPHCGSGNVKMREMSLITAISIGLGFIVPFSAGKLDCLDCKKESKLTLKKTKT